MLRYPYTFILILLYGYFIVGLFLQTLFNIAKGKVFTDKNLSNLKKMVIAMIIFTLVPIAAPFILNSILFSATKQDFEFISFSDVLTENFTPILITISIIAVRAAFKKGYKLQQEQSLTI